MRKNIDYIRTRICNRDVNSPDGLSLKYITRAYCANCRAIIDNYRDMECWNCKISFEDSDDN